MKTILKNICEQAKAHATECAKTSSSEYKDVQYVTVVK